MSASLVLKSRAALRPQSVAKCCASQRRIAKVPARVLSCRKSLLQRMCRASSKDSDSKSSFAKELAEAGGAQTKPTSKKSSSKRRAARRKLVDERTTEGFPGSDDFWEGDKWEWLGFVTQYYYIFIVLVTAAVGGYASNTYNDGATKFVESAKEDKPLTIVDAKDLFAAPAPASVDAPPPSAE